MNPITATALRRRWRRAAITIAALASALAAPTIASAATVSVDIHGAGRIEITRYAATGTTSCDGGANTPSGVFGAHCIRDGFPRESSAVVTAIPHPGFEFAGFDGDCADAGTSSCGLEITSAASLLKANAYFVDVTPPESWFSSEVPARTNAESVTTTFASSQVGSTFRCAVDAGAFQPCTTPWSPTLAHGVHTLRVVAVDPSGNADPSPATVTVDIDRVGPNTVVQPVYTDFKDRATIRFSQPADAVRYECRVLSTAHNITGPWWPCSGGVWEPSVSRDGIWSTEVRAYDDLGNLGATSSADWLSDTVAPVLTFDGNEPDNGAVVRERSVTAKWIVSERNTFSVLCTIDGVSVGSSICTSRGITYPDLIDGHHTLGVTVRDGSGNAVSRTLTFQVRATKPVAVLTGGPEHGSSTSASTATFGFDRDAVGVDWAAIECSLDGAPFTECRFPLQLADLAVGQHTLRLRITDPFGNVSDATAQSTRAWTRIAQPADEQQPPRGGDQPTPPAPGQLAPGQQSPIGGAGAQRDTTAPTLTLGAAKLVTVRGKRMIQTTVRCSEACTTTGTATLRLGRTVTKLAVPKLRLKAGTSQILRIAVPAKRTGAALVQLTARDAAGNPATRTLRLRVAR